MQQPTYWAGKFAAVFLIGRKMADFGYASEAQNQKKLF